MTEELPTRPTDDALDTAAVGLQVASFEGRPYLVHAAVPGDHLDQVCWCGGFEVKVEDPPYRLPLPCGEAEPEPDAAAPAEPTPESGAAALITDLLRWFRWEHLPGHLQLVSKPFGELARTVAALPAGPETVAALRRLLEAKDCAVRASMG